MQKYTPDFDSVGGVADFLSRKGKRESSGASHQTSLRIPMPTYLRLKAISEANDLSISELIILYVDAGLEESRGKLLESGLDIEHLVNEWSGQIGRKFSTGGGS